MRGVAHEVELDAVEVVVLGQFLQDAQLVGAHAWHGEVPVALPPPGFDDPIGMLRLHWIELVHFPAATGCDRSAIAPLDLVHAMIPPDFLSAFVRFGDHPRDRIDALRLPPKETGMLDERQDLALVGHRRLIRPIVAERVHLAAGLVDIAEA